MPIEPLAFGAVAVLFLAVAAAAAWLPARSTAAVDPLSTIRHE
jgi:ABC-type lipoprotein release transport system permease subunit